MNHPDKMADSYLPPQILIEIIMKIEGEIEAPTVLEMRNTN